MEKILKQINQLFEDCDNCVFLEASDGIITSWSKGAQDFYGYSANDAIGKDHSFLIPANTVDSLTEALEKAKKDDTGNIQCEATHMKLGGSKADVSLKVLPVRNESDVIIGFTIFMNKLPEEEQQADLFTALNQSAPIGIFILQDRKFLYINQKFQQITGYDLDDLQTEESLKYILPEDRDIVRANAINSLKSGGSHPYEYRVKTKAGEVKWILETIISIRFKGQRATLGNFMDITDSKRMEQETQEANEKLTRMVKRLEEQQRRSIVLADMRDMLQACSKMEETAPIIMGFMKKLFPESRGALFLLSNSRSDLQSTVTWGDFPKDAESNIFTPNACWGLRRGRAHVVDDVNVGPICPHLNNIEPSPYVCLPLMAKGDILGLLHLANAFGANGSSEENNLIDLKEMATTLSEYLSLSIANVKLSESLAMQSIQDVQSGLYNRRFMEESLQRELLLATRKQTPIGFIMGDLDHFKKFNDIYGHAAGDKIITQVGKIIREKFRESDIACRYGGEEFLIILPESTREDTIQRAEGLREEIKKMEVVFQGQVLNNITISLGVASYPENGSKAEELLRAADTALYKAKQEGRDRVVTA